jgi:putative phage-type endonuclease
MQAQSIEPLVPGSDPWLARITASQIAAIVGASEWDTGYSLWHSKKGHYRRPENSSMATGTHWEPVIRDWFRAANPDVTVSGEQSFEHPNGWAAANPDGIITVADLAAGLEIKTSRYGDGWGQPGTNEIAPHYMPQVQWGMFVTGLPEWTVLMATPWEIFDRTYREYRVERDEEFIAELVDAAEAFRLLLEFDLEPETDWRPKIDREVLRAMARPRSDDSIELDDATALAWVESRLARMTCETDEEAAKASLLAYAGSARRLIWRGHEIASFRNAKAGPALYAAKGLEELIPTLMADKEAAA